MSPEKEYNKPLKYWTDKELDELAIGIIGLGGANLESVRDQMASEARLPVTTFDIAIRRIGIMGDERRVTLKPEIKQRLEAEQKAREKSSKA